MLLSVVLVTSVLGESKLRGFIGLFMGLTIGLVGLDLSTGQPRLTLGIPRAGRRHRHRGRGGRRVRDRRGAVDRRPPAPPAGRGDPGRAAVHGARRLAPFVRAVAAGHRDRLPVRRGAGRRCGDADVPVVHPRAKAAQAGQGPREVRRGRHRGRCRTGGRQQRQRRRHVRAAAGPRPARDGDGRGDHRGDAHLRHPARPDPDGRPARARLDAAGQPDHRQHPAARHQPAAGPAVGAGCCRSRGRSSTPASSSSPRWARTASTRTRSTWRCCWSSVRSASPSGGSGSPCCR